MVIKDFNKNNIIFVHVPKTAGGTVENIILNEYFKYKNHENHDLTEERKALHSLNKKWTQHDTITEIISSRKIYNPEDYFKFAFVRNPWDRVVSEFLYVKNQGGCACRGNIRRMPKNFTEYIKQNFKCSWRNHVIPQYKFIYNSKNEIKVDFIGRFENLEEDIKKVLRTLNINEPYELPKVNQSRNLKQKLIKPYWLYYDKETKEIVEDKFKKDIKLFGYHFESPN